VLVLRREAAMLLTCSRCLRVARGVTVAVALLMALPASAQQTGARPDKPNPDTSEGVVITGERPAPDVHASASDFVASHAQTTQKIGQLARWHIRICPTVKGIGPEFGDFITSRIRTVAKEADAPFAEGCQSNTEIIFTREPQAVMDWVARNEPALLGYHFIGARRASAKVERPIQAWYVTATSNDTETALDSPYTHTPAGAAGSRLSHGLRSDIVHVLILVDMRVIEGHPIGPVADYLAMLALAQTDDPDACGDFASILDYLSADCRQEARPEALTASDAAFLRGLYAMQEMSIGSLQRSSVIREVMDGSVKTAP
jgi:hypothetical protein